LNIILADITSPNGAKSSAKSSFLARKLKLETKMFIRTEVNKVKKFNFVHNKDN